MRFVDSWYWPSDELHMPEWMANPKNRIILNGRPAYQGKKVLAFLKHCKQFRRAVDVGGHVGTWTYHLAARFEHVDTFEPVAAHRECFVQNVQSANVTLHDCALGAEEGFVSIATHDTTSTGGSWVEGGGDIPIRTLDSFELAVDAIKIDAEGFEEFILRGAEQTIVRHKPTICVEQKRDFPVKYGLKPQGGVAYLKTLGYRVAEELSGDYIMVQA